MSGEAVINLGAKVTVRDKAGRTPLHVAAGYGRKNIAEILIAHGTNIHAQTQDGETALHEAASNGYLYLCQLLVRQGADFSVENSQGITPATKALLNGQFTIGLYLAIERARRKGKEWWRAFGGESPASATHPHPAGTR